MRICGFCSRMGGCKRAFFCFLCVTLILASMGCGSIPLARSSDLDAQCRRDLQHAVQLRGLPLKRNIDIARESPENLKKALALELEKPENEVFLSNTGVLMRELRVIKKTDDLKSIFLKVLGEQVAAYYDPEKKRVAYVDGATKTFTNSAALSMVDRFVYVHEFCHAVEDSHYDLERLTRDSMADFDRNLALTSLVEGDAMLVGLDSVFAELPANTVTPLGAATVQLLGRMDLSDGAQEMGDCPAFLYGALLRPYVDGGVFSNRIRREAGWQAIDSVFQDRLPLTTAEILFPERRYLKQFVPADFFPSKALFEVDGATGVLTNRVGAMGIALWLGGDSVVRPSNDYGFLKGWMGDQIYFVKDPNGGATDPVWLSYWERPSLAGAFCRQAERHLKEAFGNTCWCVEQRGRLVAIVWSDRGGPNLCRERLRLALDTRVAVDAGNSFVSWSSDLPWPVRFPVYSGHSHGVEILGGHAVDFARGGRFARVSLLDGIILRAESNPDRCYWGTLVGLFRYVNDSRSDFTCWKVPVLASWFRRGGGDGMQFRWRVLWGLAGYGDERKARVLMIPVWRAGTNVDGAN